MTQSGGIMAVPDEGRPGISLDTNVLSAVVGHGELAHAYRQLLAGFTPLVTYFVNAEIRVIDRSPRVWNLLQEFLASDRVLSPPDEDLIGEYVLLKRTAIDLGLRFGADREDLWMLAQTRGAQLPVMTHDRNAARIAHAAGMNVVTALEGIEADYERDRRRVASLEPR